MLFDSHSRTHAFEHATALGITMDKINKEPTTRRDIFGPHKFVIVAAARAPTVATHVGVKFVHSAQAHVDVGANLASFLECCGLHTKQQPMIENKF